MNVSCILIAVTFFSLTLLFTILICQLFFIGASFPRSQLIRFARLLQQSISMADPKTLSIGHGTEPEDTTQDQSVSIAATESQPSLTIPSARNWILYLPPEIRLIIYRYVLLLPYAVPYGVPYDFRWIFTDLRNVNYLPFVSFFHAWLHPGVRAVTGILLTSRLIQEECLPVFYRENTFVFPSWFSRFSLLPPRHIGDMIQNFTVDISLPPKYRDSDRERSLDIIRTVSDLAIIRGRFSVHFSLPLRRGRGAPLRFYLRCLGRFTHFKVVEVDFAESRPAQTTMHCECVQNALQSVLGPAKPYATGYLRGLRFHPQRFLNAQPSQESVDWIDRLDGLRLDVDGDVSNAGQNVHESEPLAQKPSL